MVFLLPSSSWLLSSLLKIDCRKAKLHFQMTFSLPSPSCLLKLPIIFAVDVIATALYCQAMRVLVNVLELVTPVSHWLLAIVRLVKNKGLKFNLNY